MTVCALPSSDLQTSAVLAPSADDFDGRAQTRAAGADDDYVVFVGLIVGHVSESRAAARSRYSDR